MNLKKLIFIAIIIAIFYYAFIVNTVVTLSVLAFLYISFKLYKFYAKKKLNKLTNSKQEFIKSQLGLFVALVAKVAKADGRVHELEAQLIGMMFDDISKLFDKKDKARAIMKEIFNEEKLQTQNTKQIAQELNKLLGKSLLKRRQFLGFLIQLAFIDGKISEDEEKVLKLIATELNISQNIYDEFVKKFENMTNNKQQTMSLEKAYEILQVKPSDDMNTIKKAYRNLIRQYHPDIISSQNKDENYMEEATAKTQEINQAYEVIKNQRK